MFATVVQSFLVKHFSNQFDFNPFSFSHYDNSCNLKQREKYLSPNFI